MIARGRGVGLALLLLSAGGLARADWCPTYTAYPGWQILSCEDAYVNPALVDSTKGYPLSHVVDGDPRTAWVFEGIKWDGKERPDGYHPRGINHPFRGGLHQWVAVESLAKEPPLVDAVGIINGYAKDAATYQRNNRISRLRIQVANTWWSEPTWGKTVELADTLQTQVIPIPPQRAACVSFVAEEVEQGKDDDLCISEVQLYYRGRPLVPRPTPYLLYSPGDECGCGETVMLVDASGRLVHSRGPLSGTIWPPEYRFLRGGSLAVIAHSDGLVAADLATGRQVYEFTKPGGQVWDVSWPGGDRVRLKVGKPDGSSRRYEVDFSRSPVTLRTLTP